MLSIVVSAIVALIVADQQRRQMRQIELHRADPSVSLKPPPHPAARWLLNNSPYVVWTFFIIYDTHLLINQLREQGPVTRGAVFEIVFTSMCIGAMILGILGMLIFTYVQKQADEIDDARFAVVERLIEVVKEMKNARREPSGTKRA